MTLGQKLKGIRNRFGLSQEQLAEIMNVSRQAITKWENDGGLPDVANLQELSKISPYYLVKKDNLKLLVNIKDWILKVVKLPSGINDKRFFYENNESINVGKIKLN